MHPLRGLSRKRFVWEERWVRATRGSDDVPPFGQDVCVYYDASSRRLDVTLAYCHVVWRMTESDSSLYKMHCR